MAAFFFGGLSSSVCAQGLPDNDDSTRISPDTGVPSPLEEIKGARGLAAGDDLNDLSHAPVPEYEEGTPQSQRRYIYEVATVSSLSHLYWALGMMDYENQEHIDYYLLLNECKIYEQYNGQEFEWRNIRKATSEFIKKNKDEFPTRFEIVIPIRLEGYDMKRRAFRVVDEDQVKIARRFEVLAKDFNKVHCFFKQKEIPGYPKGIIVELSRPFSLTYVPAPPDRALSFVKEKDKIFQTYKSRAKTKQRLSDLRVAYLVMQLKVFGQRGVTRGFNGLRFVQAMGVLDGYEIYGDLRRKKLFYSKSYLKDLNKLEETEKLRTEYEALKKKFLEGDGLLH